MESELSFFVSPDGGLTEYWKSPGVDGLLVVSLVVLVVSAIIFISRPGVLKPKLYGRIAMVVIVMIIISILAQPATTYPEGTVQISYQKNDIGQVRYCIKTVEKYSKDYRWETVVCNSDKGVIDEKYLTMQKQLADKLKKDSIKEALIFKEVDSNI